MDARSRPRPPARAPRALPGRPTWAGLAAVLVGLGMLLLAQFHYLVPDSAGHLAWCRSLLWDRDLDFENDYARLGMIEREAGIDFGAVTPAGKRGNPFGMGAALLWMPIVAAATLVARIASGLGADVAADGFGTGTLLAAALASWTCALLALALLVSCIRMALPAAGARVRRTAVAAAALGTPLVYYVLQMPSYAHAASAFMAALLLYFGLRWQAAWTLRRAGVLGGIVGFAGLVRVQDLALGALPVLLGIGGGAWRARRQRLLLLPYALAAAAVFGLQLVAWARIYGGVAIPQGSAFLRVEPVRTLQVLFSTRHGLFVWSPVLIAAVAGWILLVRRAGTRWVGIAALVLFCLQTVANALPVDWWAGWAFGARRFTDLVPLFGVGLAVIAQSRRGRIAIWFVVALQVVQWLRVATRGLSGEADPGWSALWGGPFLAALVRAPASLWTLIRVPWTNLEILRRPQALAPSLHPDAHAFLGLCAGLWLASLWVAMRATAAHPAPTAPADPPASARVGQRRRARR